MRRILAAGSTLAVLIPAAAQAAPVTAHHRREYQRLYLAVVHADGRRAPGCELGRTCAERATDKAVVRSLHVLERILHPSRAVVSHVAAPVDAQQTSSTTPAPPIATPANTPPAPSAGATGLPACASESGTNYSTGAANTNAASGATGRYQIIPSTASAYGCNLSTPAGQDQCAQVIYQHQGAGAWVGCGG